MRIYIAGPMESVEQMNFPLFWRAAYDLREKGYRVVSPAETDVTNRMVTVLDPMSNIFHELNPLDYNWHDEDLEHFTVIQSVPDKRKYLAKDIPEVCRADGIVLLPDWERSEGAVKEKTVAEWVGKRIGYYTPGAPDVEWEDE